jgi:dTDP-4-amino-4,6-dideoxygalactose transaminase
MKPINAYGGGIVVTHSKTLADRVRSIAAGNRAEENVPVAKVINIFCETHFLSTPFSYPALYLLASRSLNARCCAVYRKVQKPAGRKSFSDFQALLGMEKLSSLDERVLVRNRKAQILREFLSHNIKVQSIIPGSLSNFYFFVTVVGSDVWKVRKFLLKKGIDAGIGSEIADDCAMLLGYPDCPNARKVFEQAVQIPLYENLTDLEVKYVAQSLSSSIRQR